tara:strand:+ start:2151 stop:2375 length:225 start_codon:yes stop_codon:yes gene_type:complete
MKKIIIDLENPNGVLVDLTAEEIELKEAQDANFKTMKEAEEEENQAKEDIKASAKAKLVAGEPLTEAEADTLVI